MLTQDAKYDSSTCWRLRLHTCSFASRYSYTCVLILLYVCLILLHMCPHPTTYMSHTTTYVSASYYIYVSYYYICVRILLYICLILHVSASYYMCPDPTTFVCSYCMLIPARSRGHHYCSSTTMHTTAYSRSRCSKSPQKISKINSQKMGSRELEVKLLEVQLL
jgi:hypothetical protein